MSDYELHHADCLDVFGQLDPASVDAVICDPPYGTTACKWDSVIPFDAMWSGIRRVLRPRGACVLFGSQPFTSALVMSNVKWFRYEWVWTKNRGTGHLNAKIAPLQATEDVAVFSRDAANYYPQMRQGTPYTRPSSKQRSDGKRSDLFSAQVKVVTISNGARYPDNILRYSKIERPIHPTQKPLALLEYLVKTYTNAGDCVLDFTMGSGTTGAACGNLDRKFIGIEKDAAYYAIAEERIATAYAPLRMMETA